MGGVRFKEIPSLKLTAPENDGFQARNLLASRGPPCSGAFAVSFREFCQVETCDLLVLEVLVLTSLQLNSILLRCFLPIGSMGLVYLPSNLS